MNPRFFLTSFFLSFLNFNYFALMIATIHDLD